MHKINLLPPKEKQEIELNMIVRWMTFFGGSLIALTLIFVVLCLNSYFYLYILIGTQTKIIAQEENVDRGEKLATVEGLIDVQNANVANIYRLQSGFVCTTPIMEQLATLVSEGVYLTNFNYQVNENTTKINGYAATRDDFIDFQDGLEEDSMFSEVVSPLSNLVKKEDLLFTINFKMNTSTINCSEYQ